MKPRNFSTFKIPRSPKIRRDAKSKTGVDQNPDIPYPLIPQAAALAPLPPGFPNTGLLRASWKNNAFELTSILLPLWDYDDEIVVDLDGIEAVRRITPEEVRENLITITLPAPRPEGRHIIRFCYQNRFIGDRTPFSGDTWFEVDLTAPGWPYPGLLHLPQDVMQNGLSDDLLTSHNDVLPCTIPSYTGRADGDWAKVTITNEDSGDVDTAEAMIPLRGAGNPLIVEVTRNQIEALGDGTYSFTYVIDDLAGNLSPSSPAVTIPVYVNEGITHHYSPKQGGTAKSAADLPGGGKPIDAPLFKTNFGYPTPHDLGYQPVYIQPYAAMAEGDTLELHITGKFGLGGSGGPVNKAEFGHAGDTPIPGFPTTYTVRKLDVDREIKMKYPWERIRYLYPICRVFAEVKVSNSQSSKLSEASTVLVDNRRDPNPPDDPDRP